MKAEVDRRGAAAPAGDLWLAIRSGTERGRAIRVGREPFLIGRDDDCDLAVRDPRISRRHVCLERLEDGSTFLRDLGSSNGTFVNGQRVASARLSGQEQIQLGDTILVTSSKEPSRSGSSTVLGSVGLAAGARADSAVHRLIQRSARRATILAAVAVLAVTAAAVLFGTGVLPPRNEHALTAVQRVVQAAASSTVLIEALRDGARIGTGTGWVLSAGEGLVVTNAHVVNGGTTFRVGAGSPRDATIVGVAPCEDLAVLRVEDANGLRSLPLGNQATLKLGETVVAVGYPVDASGETSLTSTTGVVSVARTSYREFALDIPRYPNVVQTDAAINPGNSGGPLLDLNGRLVGVNAAGRTAAPDGRIIQGQNYAIGVDRVKEIASILRTGRSIGWAGLSFEHPAARYFDRRGLPIGLVVLGAAPGTAAARDGLGERGAVITAVNGLPVDNSLASYCDAIAGAASGQEVRFTVRAPGSSRLRAVTVPLE